MASQIPYWIWPCFILSCCALSILPIWSYMLFNHSLSFEIPSRQKTNAGWACLIAMMLYTILVIYCLFRIKNVYNDTFRFRVNRISYTTPRQQVEMKPLLCGNSSSSDSSEMRELSSSDQDCKRHGYHTEIDRPLSVPSMIDRSVSYTPIDSKEDSRRSPSSLHSNQNQDSKDSPKICMNSNRFVERWSNAKAYRNIYDKNLLS